MAVSPRLRDALMKKLGVSERRVQQLIAQRSQQLMLSREQAAVALAAENGINISRFASDEDLAAIRHARSGSPSPATALPPSAPVAKRQARAAKKTLAKKAAGGVPRRSSSKSRKRVFVVHGRDEEHRRAVFAFLRAIGLVPLEFSVARAET